MSIQVTSYQLIKSQKVQLFVTSNSKLEIEVLLLEPVDVSPLLLVIEKEEKKLELDYLLVKEKLFQVMLDAVQNNSARVVMSMKFENSYPA